MTLQLLYKFNLCWLWGVIVYFKDSWFVPAWGHGICFSGELCVLLSLSVSFFSQGLGLCLSVTMSCSVTFCLSPSILINFWNIHINISGNMDSIHRPLCLQLLNPSRQKIQRNSQTPTAPVFRGPLFIIPNTYLLSRKILKKPSSNFCSSRANINKYYLLVALVLQIKLQLNEKLNSKVTIALHSKQHSILLWDATGRKQAKRRSSHGTYLYKRSTLAAMPVPQSLPLIRI